MANINKKATIGLPTHIEFLKEHIYNNLDKDK